jgi:hypothetical protein
VLHRFQAGFLFQGTLPVGAAACEQCEDCAEEERTENATARIPVAWCPEVRFR